MRRRNSKQKDKSLNEGLAWLLHTEQQYETDLSAFKRMIDKSELKTYLDRIEVPKARNRNHTVQQSLFDELFGMLIDSSRRIITQAAKVVNRYQTSISLNSRGRLAKFFMEVHRCASLFTNFIVYWDYFIRAIDYWIQLDDQFPEYVKTFQQNFTSDQNVIDLDALMDTLSRTPSFSTPESSHPDNLTHVQKLYEIVQHGTILERCTSLPLFRMSNYCTFMQLCAPLFQDNSQINQLHSHLNGLSRLVDKKRDNFAKITSFTDRVEHNDLTVLLHRPYQRLIHTETVSWLPNHKAKTIFLFNDIMVISNATNEFEILVDQEVEEDTKKEEPEETEMSLLTNFKVISLSTEFKCTIVDDSVCQISNAEGWLLWAFQCSHPIKAKFWRSSFLKANRNLRAFQNSTRTIFNPPSYKNRLLKNQMGSSRHVKLELPDESTDSEFDQSSSHNISELPCEFSTSSYVSVVLPHIELENNKVKPTQKVQLPPPAAPKEISHVSSAPSIPFFIPARLMSHGRVNNHKKLEERVKKSYQRKDLTSTSDCVAINRWVLSEASTHHSQQNFRFLLQDPAGCNYFGIFLHSIFCDENLKFCEAVRAFKNGPESRMVAQAEEIFDNFMTGDSPFEINLNEQVKVMIKKRIEERDINTNLFDSAEEYVSSLLFNDTFLEFLQSKEFRDYVEFVEGTLRPKKRRTFSLFDRKRKLSSRSEEAVAGSEPLPRGHNTFMQQRQARSMK